MAKTKTLEWSPKTRVHFGRQVDLFFSAKIRQTWTHGETACSQQVGKNGLLVSSERKEVTCRRCIRVLSTYRKIFTQLDKKPEYQGQGIPARTQPASPQLPENHAGGVILPKYALLTYELKDRLANVLDYDGETFDLVVWSTQKGDFVKVRRKATEVRTGNSVATLIAEGMNKRKALA